MEGYVLKYTVQYISAIILFIFSTFVAWYEGSAIRDNPWEWQYSAVFSKLFNGEVTSRADLSQLDHFIYAAKFNPIFPVIMILSLSYLIILTTYLFFQRDTKKLVLIQLFLSAVYFSLGLNVSSSPTIGGTYFTIVFFIIAIMHLAMPALFYLKTKIYNSTNV